MEVLSTFADTTKELEGSKYVTDSMHTPILMEIIKTVTTNSSCNQEFQDFDFDETNDDAFENEF
jgi:hypothetical protein